MNDLLVLAGAACAGLAVGTGYAGLVAGVDRLNRAYTDELRGRMHAVGLDTDSLTAWMRGRVLGAVLLALFVSIVMGMTPVGILAGAAVFALVPKFLDRRVRVARDEIRDQLVTATRNLAGQIRGQAILINGLKQVAAQTPDPLGGLLRSCTGQIDRGVGLAPALGELKDRVKLDYLSLFVLTLSIGFEHREGETLADLLDGIAHSLAENQRVDRKRESDTAAGRLLVKFLACFPLGFLALFGLLDPGATRAVFSTTVGQLILCVVAGLTWFSVWLAGRILNRVV